MPPLFLNSIAFPNETSDSSAVRIELLNTGTELLLGNTLNTHGAWCGRELFKLGLRVARQTTVPDGPAIRDALAEILPRADAVIVTGGLGPTSDDLTREITADCSDLGISTSGCNNPSMRVRIRSSRSSGSK